MKTIPLTRGLFTKVDDEDYDKYAIYRWHAALDSGTRNANPKYRAVHKFYTGKVGKNIPLSRLIINAPDGMYVDHINGDTLDNRKKNLRLCTKAENGFNRGANKNNKSGYKGVSWVNKDKRWTAHINKTINGEYKQYHIGYFLTKEEAAEAYNEKAKELFGVYANFNNI